MTPSDALAWLYSVQQFGIKPGLDNTRRLLRALQLPGTGQRFLHVAGTNGKGSTCAFMESVLRAGGERTALFTSPHLIRFSERMTVGGKRIPEDEAAQGITCLRDVVSGWDPHPTFFELTLALALDWFDRSGAETVVLETGMGGRLDATNAIKPLVSVITPIALDHQQWLGTTLAEIAGEKAGIIKPGVPAVSAPQPPEAATVLQAAADKAGTSLIFITEPFTDFPLPLPGEHQQWNAALALAALAAAGLPPWPDAVRQGLAGTQWPGRFQILGNGHLILDGGHNPHGIAQLVHTWKARFASERAHLVFGAVSEKDSRQSLRLLAEIAAEATFVTVNSPRAVPAAELAAAWTETAPQIPGRTGILAEILQNPPQDLTAGRRLLICGSLYLCGEVLAHFEGRQAFESSAQ
ncbi:MAG: folylpolyglutamate synthase/dihydrofolate synthase family protein [Verrucomicrobiota bacterium]